MVLTAILAPAATIAATSLVRIQGPNGVVATVNKAHQVLVGPAAPVDYFDTGPRGIYVGSSSPTCYTLTAQLTRPLIVRHIQADVTRETAPAETDNLRIYAGTACQTVIRNVHASGPGPIPLLFEPGYPLPVGSGMSIKLYGARPST